MSFETGKKLGLTASIINIAVPVIIVVLYGVLFFAAISNLLSTATGRSVSGSPFTGLGVVAAFVALGAMSLVGIILFLVAMHNLSKHYNEPGIFKNALWGFLTYIIGYVVAIVIIVALVFSLLSTRVTTTPISPVSTFVTALLIIIIFLIAAFIVAIVSAIFYMRAFQKLGDKSSVHSFNTAGLLYLIGTILTIVFIGGILVWIAWIFAASGFGQLKKSNPQMQQTYTPYSYQQVTPGTAAGPTKYCPYCGAPNSADSTYCRSCGRQLQ